VDPVVMIISMMIAGFNVLFNRTFPNKGRLTKIKSIGKLKGIVSFKSPDVIFWVASRQNLQIGAYQEVIGIHRM
jgi:hypothetical protein